MKRIPLRWFLAAGAVYLALMVSLFLALVLPQNLKIKELKVKLNSDTLKLSATQQERELAVSRNGLKETGAILKNRLFIPEKSILTRILGLSQKASIRVSSVAPIPQTDAAKAAGFVDTKIVVGVHYDTFPPIKIVKEDAIGTFENAGVTLLLPAIGETIEV